MKITDVKVFPVDEDKLKAYATITFDNCFIVRDLKVISGNKGYFIAMPSKKRKDGTFRDVAHPLNSETRKMIEDAVLQMYEKENAGGSESGSYSEDDAANTETEAAAPAVDEDGSHEDDVVPDEEINGSVGERTEEESEPENVPEETTAGDTEPPEPDSVEEKEKGAEENPVIEPSDDPEKAFGYEE